MEYWLFSRKSNNNTLTIKVLLLEVELLLLNYYSNQLFRCLSEGNQALDEALFIFHKNKTQESLLSILDDCREGSAILPNSLAKPEIFNWWLSKVIPASFSLDKIEYIYTIKGLKLYQNERFINLITTSINSFKHKE